MLLPAPFSAFLLQIVPGVPSHSALCNMSQWHANSSEARVEDNILYGCSGVEEALYEKPIRSWPGTMTREGARYLHVQDLDSAAGEVGKQCKSLGKVLLQAASAIASSQDTVASGLHDGAFLATKPQLKSVSEVWLSIVTAVQGVTVAFLLLFVGADARVRHILDWKRHVTARVRGLPRPPPVRAEDLSERKLACLRLALLLLTLFVSWYVFRQFFARVAPIAASGAAQGAVSDHGDELVAALSIPALPDTGMHTWISSPHFAVC